MERYLAGCVRGGGRQFLQLVDPVCEACEFAVINLKYREDLEDLGVFLGDDWSVIEDDAATEVGDGD